MELYHVRLKIVDGGICSIDAKTKDLSNKTGVYTSTLEEVCISLFNTKTIWGRS